MSAVEIYKQVERMGYDVPPGISRILLDLEESLNTVAAAYAVAKSERDKLIKIMAELFPEKSKHHSTLCDCQVCIAIETWKGMVS
jgi:ribonuclease HII